MSLKRKIYISTAASIAVVAGYLGSTTSLTSPLAATDPIFATTWFRRYNVHGNPTNSDECRKEIPLTRIRPELQRNEGDLALELCRGIWSSRVGFDVGRLYWYLRWYSPETASHLWTRGQLATSTYEPGTNLTNHFNVVDRTDNEITVRFGDSPDKTGLRPMDGIFVIRADVDHAAGVARLSLKTLVFCGDAPTEKSIVPVLADYFHHGVARLWMTTGSWGLYK